MSSPSLVVIITGMAGAGRSTAANALEDLGFLVIDNLPPKLISRAVETADLAEDPRFRLAIAVDSRTGIYSFEQLDQEILRLQRSGVPTMVVFLDADDDTLIRRYQETRRPHPLPAETIEEAVDKERKALAGLRGNANVVIDTSEMNVHELRRRIQETFESVEPEQRMRVSIGSFGFKHGNPRDVDLLFDVRFLPNPHWVPELRPLTGVDPAVAEYVLSNDSAGEFVDQVSQLLEFLVPRYISEGKAYLRIAVGCTGGRHRSVAISEELGRRLADAGVDVTVRHRDYEK